MNVRQRHLLTLRERKNRPSIAGLGLESDKINNVGLETCECGGTRIEGGICSAKSKDKLGCWPSIICAADWCSSPVLKLRKDAKWCSEKCRRRANPPKSKLKWCPTPRWYELRDVVWEKSGGYCYLCGLKMFRGWKNGKKLQYHMEHIVSLTRGGTDEISNLNGAHEYCNYAKRHALDVVTPELREILARKIQELLDQIKGS